MIQTSITAPCRRDQVADILTDALLRLLATRALRSPSQVEDERPVANDDSSHELPADKQPTGQG